MVYFIAYLENHRVCLFLFPREGLFVYSVRGPDELNSGI